MMAECVHTVLYFIMPLQLGPSGLNPQNFQSVRHHRVLYHVFPVLVRSSGSRICHLIVHIDFFARRNGCVQRMKSDNFIRAGCRVISKS